MVSNLKKQKGTTIVEVLVAVIIIGIVSVYGLSFFSSAYKHAQDSKDYSFVLHDLVRKMEMVKGGGDYPTVEDNNFYPTAKSTINQGTTDRTTYDFKVDKILRDDCKVHYTCHVHPDNRTTSDGITHHVGTQIVCEASWPWNNGETSFPNALLAEKNRIILVTYISQRWE